MKKMIVTLPGNYHCTGELSRDEYSLRRLNERGDAIASELQTAPTAIVRADDMRAYSQTAGSMKGKMYLTGEYAILPDDRQCVELLKYQEGKLVPELERISAEIDRIGEGREIVMIAPPILANSFPSYYARKKGFRDPFVPFLGWGSDVAVLDFESGKIRIVRYRDCSRKNHLLTTL